MTTLTPKTSNSSNSKKLLLLLLVFSFGFSAFAQNQIPFRLSANFSIKEKQVDDSFSLTMGRVYYDKNINILLYDVHFPKPQLIAITDTVIYTIENDSIVSAIVVSGLLEFSVFSLSLNNRLEFFGLQETPYKITDVEHEDGLVYATWSPPKKLETLYVQPDYENAKKGLEERK